MQKHRAGVPAFSALLAIAFSCSFIFPVEVTTSHPLQPSVPEAEASASSCDSDNIVVYEVDQPPATGSACPTDPVRSVQLEDDRDYLIETATPGGTMARQGPELALGRLHPEFAQRLAGAIREARQAGLASAGIFSAYRPAAFGVGGFSDKFNSLHTYGLAVDMSGIGGPGSAEARLWYEIAVKHGVVCPYGLESRTE